MNDKDAAKLIALLADYADAYGKDCPADMSVIDLADDIASANTDPSLTHAIETARDRVAAGFAS